MHRTGQSSMRIWTIGALAGVGAATGVLLEGGSAVGQAEWKEVPLKDGTYRHVWTSGNRGGGGRMKHR